MPQLPASLFAISRRGTIKGIAGATLATALPFRALAQAGANPVFQHGVASGDPDAQSVVLWTRVTTDAETPVEWEIASDPGFRKIVKSGMEKAAAERDYTVKLVASGLKPGGRYFYRFRALGTVSPVGRTRTLPKGRVEKLGIALASCSNYAFGFFNAYDAIANDPAIDFVLHTGDYIYEYGADGWGKETSHKIGRVHQPANEIVSLADYRQRHAQYKTDAGSQAMHAVHPLLALWDDHESANNPWTDGAQNHQPETEGDWPTRRAAAIQAYYEWMPVREPVPGRTRMQFWRSYDFGDLATLFTLETRHTARAKQIEYADYMDKIRNPQEGDAFVRDVIGAADRRMISQELENDLSTGLRGSVKRKQPWRIIGNATLIARIRVPDVAALGMTPDPAAAQAVSSHVKEFLWKGANNLPFYTDSWDGYGWARERFYDLSRDAGASDLLFLTGDSHSFWANRLADGHGRPAGVELGTAGISSPGDFMESGCGEELSRKLDKVFADHNDEVLWTDNMHQGYVRVELAPDQGKASFVGVSTVLSTDYRTFDIKSYSILRGPSALDLAEQA